MNQNKLLYNIKKIASEEDVIKAIKELKKPAKDEINISKEELDEFLPTDTAATLGDVFLATSRQGRRAGRATALGELADVDKKELNALSLKYPLLTSQLLAPLAVATIGAGVGSIATGDPVGSGVGAGVGAVAGIILSHIARNRRIRRIKNLIKEKGKIRTYSTDDINVPGFLNFGGKSFNYGKAQGRKFIRELAAGAPANEASQKVNPFPKTKNLIELLGNMVVNPVGSIGISSADKMMLKRLLPEERRFVNQMQDV